MNALRPHSAHAIHENERQKKILITETNETRLKNSELCAIEMEKWRQEKTRAHTHAHAHANIAKTKMCSNRRDSLCRFESLCSPLSPLSHIFECSLIIYCTVVWSERNFFFFSRVVSGAMAMFALVNELVREMCADATAATAWQKIVRWNPASRLINVM